MHRSPISNIIIFVLYLAFEVVKLYVLIISNHFRIGYLYVMPSLNEEQNSMSIGHWHLADIFDNPEDFLNALACVLIFCEQAIIRIF